MDNLVIAGKEISFINRDNHIMIDSRDIAKVFEKQHKNILRIINNRIKEDKELNDDVSWFSTGNHSGSKLSRVEDTYILGNGTKRKTYYYLMDRDIFNEVVLTFTGGKARRYRRQFIKAFNAMEQVIKDELLKTSEDFKYYKKKYPNIKQYGEVSDINKKHGKTIYVSPYYKSNPRNRLSRLVGLEKRLTERLIKAKTLLFYTFSVETVQKRLKSVRREIEVINSPQHEELTNIKDNLIKQLKN